MGIIITTLLIAGAFILATMIETAAMFSAKEKARLNHKAEFPVLAVQSMVHAKRALNFTHWHQVVRRERKKTTLKVLAA